MNDLELKFRLDDQKPLKMAEGIVGLPLGLEKAMINIVELAAGSEIPLHRHPEEQISLILKGELAFELGGKKFKLKAGEGVLIPAELPHRARAVKKTLAYDCFAPPRWDYLEKVKK